MKYLKVKDIIVKEDIRDSNVLERDSTGKPIKFKQSKCTCHITFEDSTGEEFTWVAKNESLAKTIKLIANNEDKKYNVKKNPWLLGRNMFFLSWLYEIYKTYLTKWGFSPPEKDLEKGRKFKHANKN